MRVSFEFVNEDDHFPDNRCEVSLGCSGFQSKKKVIGNLMASVMRLLELDNNPQGDTIFFRVVSEDEAEVLDELLEGLRADEWKD